MAEADDGLVHALARIAQGDRQAFAGFYQKTHRAVFGMCVHLLRDRDEACDVLQETYIQVWHHAGEYHCDRGSVQTWMMSIGRYRCLDALRRRRYEADYDSVSDRQESSAPGPMDNAGNQLDRQRLNHCLKDLDERYRSSIEMAYFRGFTHQELAVAMGEPLGTTKSWIRRGLDVLRRCLDT
ncbi:MULTISPECIES: sigma-70 family RNA polymerase sigma factor [Alcanivorax]|jgi:RNA polymerase sigma-70 factor (ECF subfamily)|uniref:RNA polymerase sigma factor n=1 Tax=Alcanivorax TaxID=59753 RepID=UPI000C55C40E|nr:MULTISPECIES: sigma-70 family RNA polymerase sigma factor [Alcanivorax]MEE3388823.1 sigma-70 family RNA polymerase sigma factor [Pseudomonadota bacterium]MBB10346.1 RNA polymerase subunit sigma [Alcanivorax sp.]MBG31497.1 RNA polymerase subunit sigma [Alcanivorax sp.]MBU84838.1 RNA polymerase subunit sigma [Alcanivorax sp.]MDF1637006.1 sigma-70 family RNA polymerase sigma factor [Alcanivorax jadensis]|tara:strand:- start:920 stop:1465 length:546 start_codon:yes stop_codon:yes gene_type:complete